jgi:hypothetical protein
MSKSKKKKDEQAPAGVADGICVAGHPRSARAVRRAKGWGGVAALLRGLAGGLVTYLVVWTLALAVARQFVVAEVRARYEDVMAAREAARSDGS